MYKRIFVAAILSAAMLPTLASAQSLLGIIGDGDSGALITLETDNAGTSGLVNLGLGGSEGAVTANIGANEPAVSAQVLGSGGVVDAQVDLGDAGASVNIGGPNVLDVDLDLPDGGSGGNGGSGGDGTNGSNGTNGGLFSIFSRNTTASSPAPAAVACEGYSTNQLVELFSKTRLSGWNRAHGIQLIPIRVCADLRRQVASFLASNGTYQRLQGAVAQDPLINAALSRTQYRQGNVLGVYRQGTTLMVYVF